MGLLGAFKRNGDSERKNTIRNKINVLRADYKAMHYIAVKKCPERND